MLAACGVASLVAAVGVVNAFVGRTPPEVSHLTSSAYVARQKLDQAATMALNAPAETLSWSGNSTHAEQGYKIQFSALQVADVLSIRMTITNPQEQSAPTDSSELHLRRAESDPGVLRRISPGVWEGAVPVYLFLGRGEERLRLVGTAHITVAGSSSLTARISVAYPELGETDTNAPHGITLWRDASGGYRFSLSEAIELKR